MTACLTCPCLVPDWMVKKGMRRCRACCRKAPGRPVGTIRAVSKARIPMARVMAQDGLYLRGQAPCVESWWQCPAEDFYPLSHQKDLERRGEKPGGLRQEGSLVV